MSTPNFVELGATRQVWFAKLSDPSTKYPFIARDDAYIKNGAQFGRTVRLGDPINLGPNSSWTQTTWEGGDDQEVWSDPQMFKSASADMNTKTGKIRMWPGWGQIWYDGTRAASGYILARGQKGRGFDANLYFAETDYHFLGYVAGISPPAGGFRVYRFTPATGVVNTGGVGLHAVRSMEPFMDESTFNVAMVVTDSSGPVGSTPVGHLWYLFEDTMTWSLVTGPGSPSGSFHPKGIAFSGKDSYFLTGQVVAKLNYGTGGWSNLFNIYSSQGMVGIAQWNNRMWFGVKRGGNYASVYVTDGVTTAKAFDIPDEMIISDFHVHYGSLFISGYRPNADAGNLSFTGMIYRYTGTTLTKLYEEGDGRDGIDHSVYALCSLGPNLVWGRPSSPSKGLRAGVKMWNAETDAIFDGPTLEVHPSSGKVIVTDVIAYDNSIVASFRDQHSYGGGDTNPKLVAQIRNANEVRNGITGPSGTNSFSYGALTTKTQRVESSVYAGEADTEAELKTWLSARVRVKMPSTFNSVRVRVILDESGIEQTIGTIAYDPAHLGWRSVDLPVKIAGEYLQSYSIQYVVELSNSDNANFFSLANCDVDTVHIQWRPAPLRRRSWSIRCVNLDEQTDLDGEPLELDTAQALTDKLEEFWSDGMPVLFWEAGLDGVSPDAEGIEVNVTNISEASFRIDTDNDVVQHEVGLTLVENS